MGSVEQLNKMEPEELLSALVAMSRENNLNKWYGDNTRVEWNRVLALAVVGYNGPRRLVKEYGRATIERHIES